MIIAALDSRGKKHLFSRDAVTIEERTEVLEEFLRGLKQGEWFMDVCGNIVSPVHIVSFNVLK